MGAYDGERVARGPIVGPINPPPDPPNWGDFSILVGAANDWYSRRGSTRGSLRSGQPMVGGMVVNRLRPSSLDILVNIESGSNYAEWAATDHILYLTTADWEVIVSPSTLSRAFGRSFGRYRIAPSDRPIVAAVAGGDILQVTFVRP